MGEHPRGAPSTELIELLTELTPRLWAIAILFFGVGDLLTTGIGLSFPQVVEAGPMASVAVHQFGLAALIPLKLFIGVIAYALWQITPAPHDTGVPLGLAALGVVVTPWNLSVILALF